jgi:hypothetical protein
LALDHHGVWVAKTSLTEAHIDAIASKALGIVMLLDLADNGLDAFHHGCEISAAGIGVNAKLTCLTNRMSNLGTANQSFAGDAAVVETIAT